MSLPRISIVTISFNQVDYLAAAIESVLGQNYPNLQYVVVDPGSTDGSRELIESYGDRISARLFEPDSGPADGLNRGFALTDGEILGYLNADDVLLPGVLHRIAGLFEESPEVDVFSGHCEIIDGKGVKLRENYSDRFRPLRVMYRTANIMQPSSFFRRRAFEKTNGFNPANRTDWDTELFIDMAAAGARFEVINEIFSGYRLHTTTVTAQHRNSLIVRKELRALFERKRGRRWRWYDHAIRWAFLGAKYLGDPRWIRERVLRGRVAGRSC
jgi:glycosyltransferase involved in cell wall biosynthesis